MIHDQWQKASMIQPSQGPAPSDPESGPSWIHGSSCRACRNVGVCGVELVQARARLPEQPLPRQDRNLPKQNKKNKTKQRKQWKAKKRETRAELAAPFSLFCRFRGALARWARPLRLRPRRYRLLTLLLSCRRRHSVISVYLPRTDEANSEGLFFF